MPGTYRIRNPDRGTAGGVAMASGGAGAAAADAGAARYLGRVGTPERRGARSDRRAGPAAARRLSRHPLQRGRATSRRHVSRVDLGHAGIPVPAALGAAPVARARRRAHPEGAGSAHARSARLPRAVHALARPSDLHGRPAASAGVGAPHLDGLLDRAVGGQHAQGHDHAPERRISETRRPADQRPLHDDGVPLPSRRHPHHHDRRGRPGLSRRAVRPVDDLRLRPHRQRADGDVQRVGVRRERRDQPPLGAALPARAEQGVDRMAEERALGARAGRARRREDDLSRVPDLCCPGLWTRLP